MDQNEYTPEEQAELDALEAEEQTDEVQHADELADVDVSDDDVLASEDLPEPTPLDVRKAAESDAAKEEEDEEQKRRRLAREETEVARQRLLDSKPSEPNDSE